jgi:hypothetical protein
MRMKKRVVMFLASALVMVGLTAPPAPAAETGVVNATINVTGVACLTVSQTLPLVFPPAALGDSSSTTANPYSLTACQTSGTEDILLRGSNATFTAGGWTLASAPGNNVYASSVASSVGGFVLPNATTNVVVRADAAPGFAIPTISHTIGLPTAGSSGAGQTVSFSYTWTAALS